MGIHTKIIAEREVPAGPILAQLPSYFLPYARQALSETVTDLELAISSDCEFRAELTAQFVIERCEFVIGRMHEALRGGRA